MALIERSLTVAASPQAAFDYLADFSTCAEWDPGVATASLREGSKLGLGAVFDVEVVFNGRKMPMVYEIVDWKPSTRVVLRGEGSRVRAVDDIAFSPEGRGSLIRYRADLRLRGFLAPLTPLLRRKFEALGDAAMVGMAGAFRRRGS